MRNLLATRGVVGFRRILRDVFEVLRTFFRSRTRRRLKFEYLGILLLAGTFVNIVLVPDVLKHVLYVLARIKYCVFQARLLIFSPKMSLS